MAINEKLDSGEIRRGEKDSPFYGRDYDSLWPSQKKIHDRYVRGEVSNMRAENAEEIHKKTYSRMSAYKLTYAKKNFASHKAASKVIFNSYRLSN